MTIVLAALFGGIFNWYRGGPFKNRDDIVSRIMWEPLRRTVYFLVQGDFVNAIAFGAFCVLALESPVHPLAVFVWAVAMMYRGATPGWGEYIGAAGGWRQNAMKEISYIDKIIDGLKDRPRLWGVAGLSLRCGEWGLFIGAPFMNFWPAAAGLLAGPIVYALSKTISQIKIWRAFEVILGALFWAAMTINTTGG